MKRKNRRDHPERSRTRIHPREDPENKSNRGPDWPGEHRRYISIVGIFLIALCTVIIYSQTILVPPIDYEDPFYLVHSPYVRVPAPFSRLGSVWDEPYFANFHPVTTTSWLVDRSLADKGGPFDALPFRITQLLYALLGASLLIALYVRIGIPAVLAVLGALLYAVHPVHTEVVAWLSARKDLVSLVFILLSFLAWLRARNSETPNRWRIWYGLTIFFALLAVLSKPVAVVTPALFVAYEFCSAPHVGITQWRWSKRNDEPLLNCTLMLTAVFLLTGITSTLIFRRLLERNSTHGGWLIFVPLVFLLAMFGFAPSKLSLAAFREGRTSGTRSLVPPFVVLSMISAAGAAWTFWAQEQVGAIKGGLTLLPTLNMTCEAMLAYAAKIFIPAFMSASYSWSSYPNVSVSGLFGATLVVTLIWAAMRLSGSQDRNHRLIAFGIFWYFIALIPVSNLVPTSTQMADRYLFVPSVGAILAILSLASAYTHSSRSQRVVSGAFALVVICFAGWSHRRTEVWCGKTALWNGSPHPDLSLWTAAVETNPYNTSALTFLGLACLRLSPPDADQALLHLNRALQVSTENQGKIAGDRQLILTHVYSALGDGYLAKASQLATNGLGTEAWRQRKDAYTSAAKYFELASRSPSGFASEDARAYSRFAEACEGLAQMEAQQVASTTLDQRGALIRERDQLRSKSEEAMVHAHEILISGNVPTIDPNYRTVMLGEGNIIFGREAGASSNLEKAGYYRVALQRYQKAAVLLPDDPRPLLYQGLCYERLTDIAQSQEEKRQEFTLGEAALRKALTLTVDSADYSLALPYQALASLYAHVGNFRSALDSLKSAREVEPLGPESEHLDVEIRSIEQFLQGQQSAN